MENLSIIDDGTLDTVLKCSDCGQVIRYSDVDREDPSWLEDYSADHHAECEGPEDLSFSRLASNWHGGQWTSLYAFASSGTVTEGLSSEIFSCIPHAEMISHPNEVLALKEFQEWAEAEEAKKFPAE